MRESEVIKYSVIEGEETKHSVRVRDSECSVIEGE